MTKLSSFSDRALDLVGQVGDNIRTSLPDTATKWLQTGAALGVARTGTRAVGTLIRRNPAVAVAAAVGAGAIWYLARRQAKKRALAGGNAAAIEGKSTRVDARRATRAPAGTRRKSGAKPAVED